MTPAAIIREANADGVNLALSPVGTLKATGDASAVNRWLPILKAYKPGILSALKEAENDALGYTPIPDDLENLIRRAGTFWEYSPEDYALVRDLAQRDPDGLRLALESDKWLAIAERRNYSGNDLALEPARQDPEGWLRMLEVDERGGPDNGK